MRLATREVPEIDGSSGAFIGLVVALSVVIVVCCAAVFYLLRYHEPTDQERTARRERYRRAREQTLNASMTGPSTSTLAGSLGDKVKQLWQSTAGGAGGGSGRPAGRELLGRRGGRGGWIRAGSDDEWAIHSDRDVHEGVDPELGGQLASLPVLKRDERGGEALEVEGSGAGNGDGDHVRIVESPLSDSGSGFIHQPYAFQYSDPFSKAASHAVLQRSQSPLSSPASSPRDCTSPGESHERYSLAHSPGGADQRHRSTMSNASAWSHGGSKFVEDI